MKSPCTILPTSVSALPQSNLLKDSISTLSLIFHLPFSCQSTPIWLLSHSPLKRLLPKSLGISSKPNAIDGFFPHLPTSPHYSIYLVTPYYLKHSLLNSLTPLFPVFLIPTPASLLFLICKISEYCYHSRLNSRPSSFLSS